MSGELSSRGTPQSGALGLRPEILLILEPSERFPILVEALRRTLADTVRTAVSTVSVEAPVTFLGLDSLAALELQRTLGETLGVELPLEEILGGVSLSDIARYVLARLGEESEPKQEFRAPLPKAEERSELPLSKGQEALWFLERLAPGSAAYHVTAAVRIRGPLDPAAWRRSFEALVARHRALRTTFHERDGEPIQRIHEELAAEIELRDASGLGPGELEEALSEVACRPFALDSGSPLRMVLWTRSRTEAWMVLAVHHLAVDYWSFAVMVRELGEFYRQETGGRPAELEEIHGQYSDHVVWQADRLAGPEGERLWAYWRQRLAGDPDPLDLPADRPRPAVQSFAGRARPGRIGAGLTSALRAMGGSRGATLHTTLTAAFQVLLHRYTGQDDVRVGSPTTGRDHPDFAPVVGYFVNPVVLRGDLSGDPGFTSYLDQTRRRVSEALTHRALPFAVVAERLEPTRDPGRSPVFQAMFIFQSTLPGAPEGLAGFTLGEAGAETELGGLTIESVPLRRRASQFDLTLSVAELGDELGLSLQGNADLFDETTLGRVLAHFQVLVESLVGDPARPLGAHHLLRPAERHQLGIEFNDTLDKCAEASLVHELFVRQAGLRPSECAVVFEDREITYGELDRRSNRLARSLRELGVGPETKVGIYLERSIELVVALWGVLKAGGAYVPLDPGYPEERLAFMLDDSGSRIVLTQDRLSGRLPSRRGETLLCIDAEEDEGLSGDPDRNPVPAVPSLSPGHPAYVIYTSGSTGRPKGVTVTHANVLNFFRGMDERVGCSPRETLLAVTSISFDISVLELLWTLTRGARVVVLGEHAETWAPARGRGPSSSRGMKFSLFYFASDHGEGAGSEKYRLLLEGARYADRHGFEAVWTPERHFHAFGGLYPNPSVMSAALAAITKNVKLRAGSVVLPLHNPVRVAEEWSLVDNLSDGRVGIAVASGWHANDFVLFPDNYTERKDLMFRNIAVLKRLWRGEAVPMRDGAGNEIEVRTLPRPVQAELPVWITAAGDPGTFQRAGAAGAHLLTHLLGQDTEELAGKVALYREARAQAGHDPDAGIVTLMLHTFLGKDRETVRKKVYGPFTEYLRSSVGLIRNLIKTLGLPLDLDTMSREDMDDLLAFAFDRYFDTSALFGDVASGLEMIDRLRAIGVDEVGCLIDFGIGTDEVLAGLENLAELRRRAERSRFSLAAQAAKLAPDLFQCTPSRMSMLLAQETAESLGSLRTLMLGGEALPPALAEQVGRELTADLVNMYGPTETTVWSATHRLGDSESVVPIGRPITNTDIHVVDRRLRPVPLGVHGELLIGRAGLARGYHERPALSAERFIPDPFSGEASSRLYRTGDRARRRVDGRLEYLGRLDHQVKLRGYRIELGEVEALLAEHPGVNEAVVAARPDAGLVAYLACGTEAPAGAELSRMLSGKLPDYMVPAHFVFPASLPRTPNGKTDRGALSREERWAPERSEATAYQAPRNQVEEALAEIWGEVLGLERVGVFDHFFRLGGHSLLATQVVARIRKVFGVELALGTLFERPVLERLAEALGDEIAAGGTLSTLPVERVARDGELVLSFAQERLWFLQELDPESTVYNEPTAVRLEGRLDGAVLLAALNELVKRHETLRTSLRVTGGRALQTIAEPSRAPVHLPRIDLDRLGHERRERERERAALRFIQRPFVLERAPLFRVALIRTETEQHTLYMVLHHTVSDGWSMGILLRELAHFYQAQLVGEGPPLPELTLQYADFAHWQRRWLRGEILEKQLAHWREHLAGLPVLELPADRPRPAVQTYSGSSVSSSIPLELEERLTEFGRARRATLFMTLAAGFQALLARYSGQEDFALGTPVAGRNHVQSEGVVGVFLNTLVLRADLAGDPSFGEWLDRMREETLTAFAHQDMPFEKLVEELRPERDLARSPLFQVLFILQNVPAEPLEAGGLAWRPMTVANGQAKFELSVSLHRIGGTGTDLAVTLEYNRDLFDATTLERFARHFNLLLRAAAADPAERLSGVSVLTAGEASQLVRQWNDSGVPESGEPLVYRLFEAQAERTPDAAAAVFGEGWLSYRELERRAAGLAGQLRELGVETEDRVGLHLERSQGMLVALLSCLRSGATYVPLDPSFPAERLSFMARDANLAVLVGDRLAGYEGPRIPPSGLGRGSAPPAAAAAVSPDHLAYAIYTSGSTGRPKGVAISHRALANFLTSMAERPGIEAGDVLLAVTTLSFDIAGLELYLPLLRGARVVVADRETVADGRLLAGLLERSRATLMQATPATWWLLVNSGWEGTAGLKALCGGEALPRELAESLEGRVAGLWNMYGPTETTIWSALDRVGAGRGSVSVGRPVSNTEIYLLGRRLETVPAGCSAELLIGGTGLARGYLGRGALTAEKFVPDPFTLGPGGRLYRTGDLARRRADGSLDVLGRIDHQVKVRGFRIELREIEAVLAEHPAVRAAAVTAQPDASGRTGNLAAHVVPAGGPQDPDDLWPLLEESLRGRLPDYMVPAFFSLREDLPLTPNGKVDRKALAAAVLEETGHRRGGPAPRTPTEEVLAALFADVLRVERVGATDHFFKLGGHSLLAMQLVSRIREAFGVELPVRAALETPTVAGLAASLDAMLRAGAGRAVAPIEPAGRDQPLPLTFGQQRLWFLDQLQSGSPAYNEPRAVRFHGPLDAAVLAASLNEVVRRHEILRTTIATAPSGEIGGESTAGGEPVQVVGESLGLASAVVDLTGLATSVRRREADRLMLAEAVHPFDLARGPLVRHTLVALGAEEHLALLTTHHIVSDGWSIGVLLKELGALYEAAAGSRPSPLPELTLQYGDYALWQRRWFSGERLGNAFDYWRKQLARLPALELPTDRPRPALQTLAGKRRPFSVSPEVFGELEEWALRHEATAFMALLAAFQTLLSRWSGQADVAVGTPVAGRNRQETEDLIGFFVNTLVIRTDLGGRPSFTELLGRVRHTTLEAYAHQDLPFEKLVEELQPDRDLSHTPLFQVVFAFQNTPLGALEVGPLRLEPMEVDNGTAKFDLTVLLEDAAAGGMTGSLEYNTDLFDATTAARLCGQFDVLVRGLLAEPDRPVSELVWLTVPEEAQVLREWNDTAAPYDRRRLIHQLFESRARTSPAATAAVDASGEMSYGELNRESNRLAHHLRRLGVGRGDRVAIWLDRSAKMLVALLGTLKAGAAYVPLESRYPPKRMRWILERLAVRAILVGNRQVPAVEGDLTPRLPALRHVVCLDLPEGGLTAAPEHDPEAVNDSDDLAYVIFTSGSTGTPKGVMVRHRPVVNLIEWVHETTGMGAGDRVLFVTSLSFDLSVYDVFGVLAAGGSVRVASEAEMEDPEVLARVLASEPVTFWDSAPAALQQVEPFLRAAVREHGPGSLRQVFLSGDWIPLALPERLRESFPGARLTALGGATEATVWSNFHRVRQIRPEWASVPYGRPIANARYYVLDATLRPCPAGAPGDLFIGGECLSSGYAAEPVLSARQYLPDPFAEAEGAVMYRTGDRARFWGDGTIEFLGRLDHQVKVRGFRIELGEIEAALGEHPGIHEAVAVARDDGGEKRLVAYVVPADGSTAEAADLRDHLRERLPEYMIPSIFMTLESLPVTANGKLDRKALPRPDRSDLAGSAPAEARTGAEEVLAGIWREVLRLPEVGIHDNFFELGGDSILSISVVTKANQAGLGLSPRQFFEHQTVAELAAVAELTKPERGAESQDVATGPVALTPIQRWFLDLELVEPNHFNQGFLFESRSPLDVGLLSRAVAHLVRHHDALRLRLWRSGGRSGEEWRQEYAPLSPGVPVVAVDLAALPDARRGAAVESTADLLQASLDLARGPLLRAGVLDLGARQGQRLLLAVHHLAVDGVSWRILLEDLQVAYRQLAAGGDVTLPAKTTSYERWAHHLALYASQPQLHAEAGYWSRLLRSAGAAHLPVDHSMGSNTEAGADEVLTSFDEVETEALLRELPEVYRTRIDEVLLAALGRTLGSWSGSTRVLVDLEGHGREDLFEQVDLSRTVGWFTALYPVLLENRPGWAPATTLKHVKESLRGVPGRGIGYGVLRFLAGSAQIEDALGPRQRAGVIFNYLGQLEAGFTGESLLEPASEKAGRPRSPAGMRPYLLEVDSYVVRARLHVRWTYSTEVHRRSTVEGLARQFASEIVSLIEHSRTEAMDFSPSDFSAADLDQEELDDILAELG